MVTFQHITCSAEMSSPGDRKTNRLADSKSCYTPNSRAASRNWKRQSIIYISHRFVMFSFTCIVF